MKNKNIYILTFVLSIIVILGVIYKKSIDKSEELKREEVLQASDKLKQLYFVLNDNLNKVDDFSNLYLNSILPKRELICSNQKMKGSSNKMSDLKSNMKVLDYDLEFLPGISQTITLTDVYVQDLKSPEYLKFEKDASGFPLPVNYWKYVDEYSSEHTNKDSWSMQLLDIVDFKFEGCEFKSDELAKQYNKYNSFLKDEIKMRMKKIEDFYNRNNLNLADLKSTSK